MGQRAVDKLLHGILNYMNEITRNLRLLSNWISSENDDGESDTSFFDDLSFIEKAIKILESCMVCGRRDLPNKFTLNNITICPKCIDIVYYTIENYRCKNSQKLPLTNVS